VRIPSHSCSLAFFFLNLSPPLGYRYFSVCSPSCRPLYTFLTSSTCPIFAEAPRYLCGPRTSWSSVTFHTQLVYLSEYIVDIAEQMLYIYGSLWVDNRNRKMSLGTDNICWDRCCHTGRLNRKHGIVSSFLPSFFLPQTYTNTYIEHILVIGISLCISGPGRHTMSTRGANGE